MAKGILVRAEKGDRLNVAALEPIGDALPAIRSALPRPRPPAR